MFLLPAFVHALKPDTLRITADVIEGRCNLFTFHLHGDDLRKVESEPGTRNERLRFHVLVRDRDQRIRIPYPKRQSLEFKAALQTFCSAHHIPVDWPEPYK